QQAAESELMSESYLRLLRGDAANEQEAEHKFGLVAQSPNVEETSMTTRSKLLACLPGVVAALTLAATSANAACMFTPPLTTQTKCVTAIAIPGNPLRSFDISWVNPKRAEYYFADRSNAAVQVIDTQSLTWKRPLGGFVGVKLNGNGTVNNNISGPDGVTS